jgi:hypothetical protein
MHGKHNTELVVICVKSGKKYSPDYANRLYRAVRRHLTLPHSFHCLTDDGRGLDEGIETRALPADDPGTCWNKLHLFDRDVAVQGTTVLYLDLDVVITGCLDDLIHHRPDKDFLGQPDWNRPLFPQFNSSVMRFRAGAHEEILEEFLAQVSSGRLVRRDEWDATTRGPDKVTYRRGWRRFGGDQEWITSTLRPKSSVRSCAFPPGWVVSYKRHARRGLPPGAKVVVFHGSPKPHEVDQNYVRQHWR